MGYFTKKNSKDYIDKDGHAYGGFEGDCESFGALAEFIGASRYEDGSPRVTGSLTVFVEEGSVKVCVNDRDGARVAFVTFHALEGLWERLEEKLREPAGLDWRRSRDAAAKKR